MVELCKVGVTLVLRREHVASAEMTSSSLEALSFKNFCEEGSTCF